MVSRGVSASNRIVPHGPLRVLVVEDQASTRLLIGRSLVSDGFVVEDAVDAHEARRKAASVHPDVMVLDVELPDGNGFDLLREFILSSGVPVVMLSSRGDEADRVRGLELGAEDYIVKPFLPRELAARVRRAAGRRKPPTEARYEFPGLTIDALSREVIVDGRPAALTSREFDLLAYLARAPGQVFTHQQLLTDVWHSSGQWQTRKTVTEHIRRLRLKIEADPARPQRLKSVARVGYRLEP